MTNDNYATAIDGPLRLGPDNWGSEVAWPASVEESSVDRFFSLLGGQAQLLS